MKKIFIMVLLVSLISVIPLNAYALNNDIEENSNDGLNSNDLIDDVVTGIDVINTCINENEEDISAECFSTSIDAACDQNEPGDRLVVRNRAWFAALRTVYSGYNTHYSLNVALGNPSSYIYGQGNCPNYYIGYGRMDDTGCEVAAIYNVAKRKGYSWTVPAIIKDLEMDGYTMYSSIEPALGVDPYGVGDYLNAKGISSTEYTNKNTFTQFILNNIRSYKVYSMSYWNTSDFSDGLHTVSFFTNGDGIYVYVFNEITNSTTVSYYTETAFSSYMDNCNFIVGNYYGSW